jgi:hypothetical protein
MKPIVKLVSLFLLAALVFVPLQSASAKGLLDGPATWWCLADQHPSKKTRP